MFFSHGAQKLFGWFGGNSVELMSLFGLAGIIYFTAGLLITAGLFTRTAAFFGILNMTGAWVKVHIPQGWIPILNGGELALLYLTAFLVILVHGSKKWGLDNLFFKKS